MASSKVWNYFVDTEDGEVKCTLCNKRFAKDRSNQSRHLERMHSLVMETQPNGTLDTFLVPRLSQDSPQAIHTYRDNRTVINVLASLCLPFTAVHDPFFKLLCMPMQLPSRITLALRTRQHAQSLLMAAMDSLKGMSATIAIDSGTIWRKYMVAVIISGNKSLLLRAETAPSFTADWIAGFIERCIAMLPNTCDVVGIVSDNASNMRAAISKVRKTEQAPPTEIVKSQSTAPLSQSSTQSVVDLDAIKADAVDVDVAGDSLDSDEDSGNEEDLKERTRIRQSLKDNFSFLLGKSVPVEIVVTDEIPDETDDPSRGWYPGYRCLAHGIQLLLKDLIAELFPFLDTDLIKAAEITGVKPHICETRWNSRTDLAAKILKRSDVLDTANPLLTGRLKQYMMYGVPIQQATDLVQSDAANVWTAICAYERILSCMNQDNLDGAKARRILLKRTKHLISEQMITVISLVPIKIPVSLSTHEGARRHAERILGSVRTVRGTPLPGGNGREILLPIAYPYQLPHPSSFDPPVQAFTCADVRDKIEQMGSQRLLDCFEKVSEINPTEASVERVFSSLKRMIGVSRKSLTPASAVSQVFVNALNLYGLAPRAVPHDAPVRLETMSAILRAAANEKLFPTTSAPNDHGCAFCKALDEDRDMVCCDFCNRWACKTAYDDIGCDDREGTALGELWKCKKCIGDDAIFRTFESLDAERRNKSRHSDEEEELLPTPKPKRRRAEPETQAHLPQPPAIVVQPHQQFKSKRLQAMYGSKE